MEIDEYNTEELCFWTEDPDDWSWATDCGEFFNLVDGTPEENGMEYCCYCGKRMKEKLHVWG